MIIDITNEQDITYVNLTGRLDTNTSPELQKKLEDYYTKSGFHIVLNLSGLEFVSSAGLRVLLLIQKKTAPMKGKLILNNVSQDVKEVFEMTGFLDFLTIQ